MTIPGVFVWATCIVVALGAGAASGQTTTTGSGQATSTGSGQAYPYKPIRVVTSAAGGGTDFVTRIVAQGLTPSLGQQVIVDNRPTMFHGIYLRGAPPDGYSLLLAGEGLWQLPLMQQTPYDPLHDFAPVTLIGISPNVLVAHPSLPVKSVKELIDLAKAKPGTINYGSTTPGASAHLAAAIFMSLTGINLVQIPHKGTGDVIISLLAGQGVQLAFLSIASIGPQIKAGRVRAIAVTSAQPSAVLPGLPAVAETVPGYQSGGATALFAPLKTPAAIVARLNRETVRLLNTAEVKEKLLNAGIEVVASTPEALGERVKSETVQLTKVIKDAGIKLN